MIVFMVLSGESSTSVVVYRMTSSYMRKSGIKLPVEHTSGVEVWRDDSKQKSETMIQ